MSTLPNLDELPEGDEGVRYITLGKIRYRADHKGIHPVRDWIEQEPKPANEVYEAEPIPATVAERTRLELECGRNKLAENEAREREARGEKPPPSNPTMVSVLRPTTELPPPENVAEVVRKDTEQLMVQERFDEQRAGKGPKAKKV